MIRRFVQNIHIELITKCTIIKKKKGVNKLTFLSHKYVNILYKHKIHKYT